MELIFQRLILVLFCSCCIAVNAQKNDAIIQITQGAKKNYNVGDELTLELRVTMPNEMCIDGMENSKVYLSGLEIVENQHWIKDDNGNVWSKELKIKVIQNKKGQGKITAFRKADKGSFFSQLKLDVNDNNSN